MTAIAKLAATITAAKGQDKLAGQKFQATEYHHGKKTVYPVVVGYHSVLALVLHQWKVILADLALEPTQAGLKIKVFLYPGFNENHYFLVNRIA